MNDHEELLKAAWEDWHAGTGMDVDDMPPANPSFKAGFNAGLVAAHGLHCKALVKIDELQSAIEKTLSENGHLADGEVCTLIDLKRVMRGDFSPWTKIDYANPSTYPDENRPCIVAWENHPEHPERHAMHMIIADFDTDALVWADCSTGESNGWWLDEHRPTHWMYALEYQP